MQILEENYPTHAWTGALKSLKVETQCILVEKSNYPSLRTIATRLKKELGYKYSFKTIGDNIKIWRVK